MRRLSILAIVLMTSSLFTSLSTFLAVLSRIPSRSSASSGDFTCFSTSTSLTIVSFSASCLHDVGDVVENAANDAGNAVENAAQDVEDEVEGNDDY